MLQRIGHFGNNLHQAADGFCLAGRRIEEVACLHHVDFEVQKWLGVTEIDFEWIGAVFFDKTVGVITRG